MKLKPATSITHGNGTGPSRKVTVRRLCLFSALTLLGATNLHAANGLTGQYYDTAAFGTLKTTRTDATVNFDWGTSIPTNTALTSGDTFSVAWSGQVEPEFSQLYTFYVTADDGARLWVNEQLLVTRTYMASLMEMRGQMLLTAGERVNIRLEYIEQTGNAKIKLEWSCASRAREVIPTERLYSARTEKAGGALLKEHWSNIAGNAITSLTSNVNFPNKPGGREFITSFECLAQDWTNAYGTRVTGFLVPPTSGSYTFAISGDDVAELYLSTDGTSSNMALIASVSSATGFRDWNAQPSQQSAARALAQGQRYYVELLHKESTGNDHWSVGWKQPGDSAFSVVPGSALLQPGLTTAQPAEASLLNTLAQEHPRIFATPERFAKLRATWQSAAASQPKTWAQNTVNSANAVLTQAPVEYAQDVRGTILDQSRTAKDRLYKLGVAWQLTGDSRYAERAWEELSAVAAFPDWHPAHFLDTAEMTHACALGYDWFYPYWTPARRDTIRNAIITLGLNAGLSQYTSNAGWSQSTGNNWNMVCNGGLSIGALAVGTESEALTENILNRVINSTRPVWKHFTTDCGAWYEGPGYWGYTTEYGIRMLAALEGTLGSDFGISGTTGVSESGLAPIESTGPSNVIFNFADAGAGGPSRGPVFQWMARRYGLPLYDWWENQGGGGALDALWWNDSTASLSAAATPPDMAFHGEAGTAFQPQEMVTMRGRWEDVRATFIGCKGGEMGAAHGNLDAGTFVLDALGKRWFHDLGGDDYALPGYFNDTPSTGTDRWDYYRMRPEGQNTLTINPSANADMVLNAVAPLVAYQSESAGSGSFAIHDLTSVYSGMTRVWRGTRLFGTRDEVLIQDEIQSSTGKTVWWFAHFSYPATAVTLDPDGSSALMTQGSERLWCKILSGGGTFQLMDAVPLPSSPNPSGQNANSGYKKLAIHLTQVTNTTLAVWFVPLSESAAIPTTPPTLSALNTWNLAAANDAPVIPNGSATGNGENAVDIDLRNYVTDDATPPEQMRFSVLDGVNGNVILLADGHTARFTPTPGFTGVPSFRFMATDTAAHPNTILAYDFDWPDASATNAVPDVSGLGRDGTLNAIGNGAATLQTDVPAAFGREGRSLDLAENGGANAARLSRLVTSGELNFNTADWTIAGWIKRRDGANEDMIWHLNSGDGYGSNEELYLMAHGVSSLSLHHYPGPDVNIISSNGVTPGVWVHCAVTRSGAKMSLFLNGASVGEDPSFSLAINQTYPLIFGGHTDTSATYAPRWLDGRLDDFAVFNTALPQYEIARLASGMTVRHFGGLSSTGTITIAAAPATHVWTNTLSGTVLTWSSGPNWSGHAVPNSGRGTSVQFFTDQTLAGGAITSRNDRAEDFVLNNLTLAGAASAVTTVAVTGSGITCLNNGLFAPTVTLSASAGPGLTYTVATPTTLGDDTTFGGNGSANFRFSGPITGTGALVKTGGTTLTLTGSNTYSGDSLIGAGTLQIGADGATGSLGTGAVVNNGHLRFDRTGTLAVPNNISGTGYVTIDCPISAGTIVFSGTNTFTGNVIVNSGALRVTGSAALGAGTKAVTLSNGTSGAPQLRLDGSNTSIELPDTITYKTSSNTGALINEAGNNTISGDITLTGGGGDTKILVSAGTLTLNGSISPNLTGRNLLLSGAGTGIITGAITNGGGVNTLAVSKNDTGTWLLSGTNTYSGITTINAGILALGSAGALGHGGLNIGNANGGSSLSAGATLDLNGQTGVNEVLTLRGNGTGGTGALVNSAATPASIAGGIVSAVAVISGGTHSTVPTVSIEGPGTNCTAVATLGLTTASFAIDGGTTVYSSPPTVSISGGGGSGATATANLSGGVVSGITLTSAGAGYTNTPAVAFTGGTVTTAGINPTGTGNSTNFTVSGITVTSSGNGYTRVPTVSFGSGTGTTANAYLSSVIMAANTAVGGGDILIHAPISGAYALTKLGPSTLTLAGTNTYTGGTTVSNGTLVLSGTLSNHVTVAVGTLAPSGTPSVSGNLSLHSGGHFSVRINGPAAGTQFDQLTVGGNVTLAGALDLQAGPNLPPGSEFTILNSTGTNAVSGTFLGKANNGLFTADGYIWRLAYDGGSGNDVVLSLISVSTITNVWVNATPDSTLTWTTGSNWQTGTPPLSSADGTIEFLTGRTLTAGTLTSSNDCADVFQLARLRLAGNGPATGKATVSLVGNALTLGAGDVAPAIMLDATAGAGGVTYTLSNPITLSESATVQGTGTATFILGGALTGGGGLAKSGSAELTLAGANTFSGGIMLDTSSGVVRATISTMKNSLGNGSVAIGDSSTLLIDNVNTAGTAVAVQNPITGSGGLLLNFATNTTARSTKLSGVSGFAGTIQLINTGNTGDKWDASAVQAPEATVQIDGGSALSVNSSASLGSLAVRTIGDSLTNSVTIAAGQTLTLSGAGGLSVGVDSGTNSLTRSKLSGGGSLAVTNASANFVVGKAQASQNYANSSTLDLSGLSSVILGGDVVPINELRIGFGLTATGLLTLANTNNTLTAMTLQVGHSNGGNAGGGTLILGPGTNVLAMNTINIGLSKSSGTLKFASQTPGSPGTVTIVGATKAAADFLIGGKTATGTSATPVGTLDLRGHPAIVNAGTVTLGKEDSTSTTYNGGTTGRLYFDSGSFTASNLIMAAKSGACVSAATATLTVSGGVFTVLAGGTFTLASQTAGGSASGTLTLNGGIFRCNADIRDGGGNATSAIILNGGTLDMTGQAIGPEAQHVDLFQALSGTLMNLGPFNDGAPLVKTGAATLTLAGTNTYSGATIVSNGTLRLTGPAPLPRSTAVYLVSGATALLDFTGTQTVHAVFINGAPKSAGVYGQSKLSPYLSGSGYLKTEWPPSSSTVFMLH